MAIKVIIADDHRLFRVGVKTILAPFKKIKIVAEACNGEELINLVRELLPDIVLLDLRMPVMNGFEALEHISKKYKQTKVIVISGYNEESHIVHAIECGASAYLDHFHADDRLSFSTCSESKPSRRTKNGVVPTSTQRTTTLQHLKHVPELFQNGNS